MYLLSVMSVFSCPSRGESVNIASSERRDHLFENLSSSTKSVDPSSSEKGSFGTDSNIREKRDDSIDYLASREKSVNFSSSEKASEKGSFDTESYINDKGERQSFIARKEMIRLRIFHRERRE